LLLARAALLHGRQVAHGPTHLAHGKNRHFVKVGHQTEAFHAIEAVLAIVELDLTLLLLIKHTYVAQNGGCLLILAFCTVLDCYHVAKFIRDVLGSRFLAGGGRVVGDAPGRTFTLEEEVIVLAGVTVSESRDLALYAVGHTLDAGTVTLVVHRLGAVGLGVDTVALFAGGTEVWFGVAS